MIALLAMALPGCKMSDADGEETAAGDRRERFRSAGESQRPSGNREQFLCAKRAGELEGCRGACRVQPRPGRRKIRQHPQASRRAWTYAVQTERKGRRGRYRLARGHDRRGRRWRRQGRREGADRPRRAAERRCATLEFVNFSNSKIRSSGRNSARRSTRRSIPFWRRCRATGLASKTVTVTGAFPLPASGQLPLITPAELTVGP